MKIKFTKYFKRYDLVLAVKNNSFVSFKIDNNYLKLAQTEKD